ncbi:MAG: HAD family hydrolase [Candidatus Micrarchaeia archaeon]
MRPSAELKPLLEKLGIAQYIDAIFVSSEIRHEKPEREAYEAVLKKFAAVPADSVFVGHDKEEPAGARMLGIRTISYRGDPGCDCVA